MTGAHHERARVFLEKEAVFQAFETAEPGFDPRAFSRYEVPPAQMTSSELQNLSEATLA